MLHRLAAIFASLVLVGSLAACGDDDTDSSAPDNNDTTEAASNGAGDESGSEGGSDTSDNSESGSEIGSEGAAGDWGTATVAGTDYPFDNASRCNPDSIDIEGLDDQIEAQFFSTVRDRGQLDIFVAEVGGNPIHEVSWAGPEGIFGASFLQIGGTWMGDNDTVYQDSPVVISGDRATGSIVLFDSMTMEEELELDFDVTIPSETIACR